MWCGSGVNPLPLLFSLVRRLRRSGRARFTDLTSHRPAVAGLRLDGHFKVFNDLTALPRCVLPTVGRIQSNGIDWQAWVGQCTCGAAPGSIGLITSISCPVIRRPHPRHSRRSSSDFHGRQRSHCFNRFNFSSAENWSCADAMTTMMIEHRDGSHRRNSGYAIGKMRTQLGVWRVSVWACRRVGSCVRLFRAKRCFRGYAHTPIRSYARTALP